MTSCEVFNKARLYIYIYIYIYMVLRILQAEDNDGDTQNLIPHDYGKTCTLHQREQQT